MKLQISIHLILTNCQQIKRYKIIVSKHNTIYAIIYKKRSSVYFLKSLKLFTIESILIVAMMSLSINNIIVFFKNLSSILLRNAQI